MVGLIFTGESEVEKLQKDFLPTQYPLWNTPEIYTSSYVSMSIIHGIYLYTLPLSGKMCINKEQLMAKPEPV